jgi:predicted GTPase
MAPAPPADPAVLLERLERWAGELCARGLGDEERLGHLQATLAQSRLERLDAPTDPLLVVMLCGPTAVGKSSLINAIAGAEISCPGLGAMTSAAVLYVHEQDDPARLFEYGEAVGQLARQPHTVVRHGRNELLHKVLVDTPDLDSAVRQHRELTAALVHAADIVLFVTTPEKYKTMQAAQ